MVRATLVKLLAAALVVAELLLLAPAWRLPVALATGAATVAFFAWAIAWPSAQFLVPSVHRLPPGERGVAFTFDDGPDTVRTTHILDLLARRGAKATFFVVGHRAAQHPELLRRIVREGHALGSHTHQHGHGFHFGSAARMREEVQRGIDAVTAITGRAPRLFRPPQGLRTPFLRDALRGLDVSCVTWTARGLDATGRRAEHIVERLEPHVREGSILTLHDGGGLGGTTDRAPTVEALAQLLDIAAQRGLPCVSLGALERHAPTRATALTTKEAG